MEVTDVGNLGVPYNHLSIAMASDNMGTSVAMQSDGPPVARHRHGMAPSQMWSGA
jgi:hypothetical protein